jgi:hypothetical protein
MAGLVLSGTNWAATNDKTALDITGDIDIRVAVAMTDWTPVTTQCLTGKWPGGGTAGGYKFVLLSTGILRLSWTETGPTGRQADSTVAPTVSDGALLLVRVTLDVNDGGGNRVIQFFTRTSTTGAAFADASSDAGWTQLGTTITTAGTTNIVATTDGLAAGSEATTGGQRVIGTEYAVVVKSGIAGTTVANPDFNANTPTFTDGSGNVWYAVSTTSTDFTIGLPEETDSAFAVSPATEAVTITIGLATETDIALPVSADVGFISRPLVQREDGPGCGEWTAYIVGRGGSPTRFELEFSSISVTRALNASGSARVSIPNSGRAGSSCCEVFAGTEPWRDELLLYRNNEVAYVGPIQSLSASLSGGDISSIDLFAWMEQRFLEEDFHGDGDVADIFRAVFEQAYDKDDSPNISISTRPTGVDAVRDFRGVEFKRAADVLRELARTGLDFTMDGRRLLAGGVEVFLSTTPLILHDEGCIWAEVTREGSNFATDVSVFGDTENAGGIPITGRAIRSTSVYGLIQRTFTELTIRDETSADANALARLESMQPAPLRVRALLSAEAAFGFSDLIPGRRSDVRLKEAAGCIEVMDTMRLQQVNVNVQISETGSQEQISMDLVPLGVSEAAG